MKSLRWPLVYLYRSFMTVLHLNECHAYIASRTFCAKNCAAISSAAVSLSRYEFSAQQLIKTRSNSVSIWYFTSRWYFWLLLFQCVVDIQQFLLDFMSFIITVVNRICLKVQSFQYDTFDSIISSSKFISYILFCFFFCIILHTNHCAQQ